MRRVAATNRDLEKMRENREFRSDLYYRLNVFPIRIPLCGNVRKTFRCWSVASHRSMSTACGSKSNLFPLRP